MSRLPDPAPKVMQPLLPWTGGCQCGAVRYTITAAPITLYECHCTECQRQSASAHGLSMLLASRDIGFEGSMRSFKRDAGGAAEVECYFCGDCGVRLRHGRGDGSVISLKAGTLDDTSWLSPVGYIWTRSAQAGTILDTRLLRYEGQPPDYDALVEAWRRATS